MDAFSLLKVEIVGGIASVTLDRPDLHNAFNPLMVGELTACFTALADDPGVRVAVLTGAGRSFCAGADLQWMRESLGWSYDENLADADRLAAMYEAVNDLPKPLIGRINGAAIGGGAGLVACCDLVIATDQATFGFTEVKLGLVPAVIARFVVPRIGPGHARALFLTGARFGAGRAAAVGLVHQIVAAAELDSTVAAAAAEMISSGPRALARAKALVAAMQFLPEAERRAYTVAAIADARTGDEGQAGIAAFLEKRRPPWSL